MNLELTNPEKKSKNRLRVADRNDMMKIKEHLEKYFPHCATVYGVIEAGLQCKELLALNGTNVFFADGSSLVVTTPMTAGRSSQSLSVFWDENEDDDAEIARLLATIPDFEWDKEVFFFASPPKLIEKAKRFIVSGRLGGGDLNPQPLTRGYVYGIEMSNIRLQVPKGFKLRRVRAQDASVMCDHWKYGSSQTFSQYQRLLQFVPGYAIEKISERHEYPNEVEAWSFSPESLDQGNDDDFSVENIPVSWTHFSPINTIRNTFTLPQYRRRGLASVVTLAMADYSIKTIGRATLYVEEENEASIFFHEKIGFVRQCSIGWQRYTKNPFDQLAND